jgi:hypothetical protein
MGIAIKIRGRISNAAGIMAMSKRMERTKKISFKGKKTTKPTIRNGKTSRNPRTLNGRNNSSDMLSSKRTRRLRREAGVLYDTCARESKNHILVSLHRSCMVHTNKLSL